MTALTLNVFGGMIPRAALQKMPPTGSERAVNCDLLSGDLKAIKLPTIIRQLTAPAAAKVAFRIPAELIAGATDTDIAGSPEDLWVGFESEFSHFVRGPLVNDKYKRWFWTSEGRPPQYNTLDRIKAGQSAFPLGIPRPTAPPTVAASGGNVALTETRCYVYTFISQFGEEGAPSEPTCQPGNSDGTWTLGGMNTTVPAPYNIAGHITKKRIYRTVTGQTGGSFFFVAEVAMGDAGYTDTLSPDQVSLNAQLMSDAWAPPPDNLVGLIRHPNGFLVGFTPDSDLHFSLPYRPWAWPAELVLSVQGRIRALGIFGNAIAVTTGTHPYVAAGTTPGTMTLTKSDASEPCLSRYAVVSTKDGVLYPSPNGIVLIHPGGLEIVTEKIVTRDEWMAKYRPTELRAARMGRAYFAIAPKSAAQPSSGFVFSPSEANSTFSELDMLFQDDYRSLQTDEYNSDLYSIRGDNAVWRWTGKEYYNDTYIWRTMEFVTPKPINFGAFRIDFAPTIQTYGDVDWQPDFAAMLAWNTSTIANPPLGAINTHGIGVTRRGKVPKIALTGPARMSIGGSPLYPLWRLAAAVVTLEVYGGRRLRHVKMLTKPGIYRLPIGYKADIWQFQLSGTANVHHLKIAETGKELASV